MLLHFRSHLTILDVIFKFALYIRYHRNGEGRQREFDFLALAVFADNVAALPVFLIVKSRNRLIKGINHRLADLRIKVRGGDQDIIIPADVADKIISSPYLAAASLIMPAVAWITSLPLAYP